MSILSDISSGAVGGRSYTRHMDRRIMSIYNSRIAKMLGKLNVSGFVLLS